MNDTIDQTRIFYEIAMSIGNSLDLHDMLKESISSYLKELDCSAGIVLEIKQESGGSFRFSPVFSTPLNVALTPALRTGPALVPEVASEPELVAFRARLPIFGGDERGRICHIMELPDFGLLLLVKSGDPLSQALIQGIGRLNEKLAGACKACFQNEGTRKANRELAHRVQGCASVETDLSKEMGPLVDERTPGPPPTRDVLQSTNRLLEDIIEFLPDAVLVLDNEKKVILWNHAMEEMTGIAKGEIIGKDDYTWMVPFHGSKRPHLIDLLDSGDSELEEKYGYVRRRGDKLCAEAFVPNLHGGRGGYVFATAAPLYDAGNRRVGSIEFIRDITEQKDADEAMVSAEAKFRSIFENAVMGIFQITPRAELISANNALATMLGYESADELLRSKSELHRGLKADADRYAELIRTVERDGVVHEFECQCLRKDGTSAWISINARAVRDGNNVINYLEGTASDITGRKMLESRLLQAQKMEAIGTLAGGIAHDFNNILAAVVGFAEMTQMALRDQKLNGYMDQILQACDRAKNLVGQILAFSRADRQEKKPVDIGRIVDEARRLLRATLPSTVEIRVSKASEVHPVLADRTQIHQVIINLCTNSTHAMREKGGVIEIELDNFEMLPSMKGLHPDLDPGPYVKISVSDTGSGIDPAIMGRIFDPFFTTKKPGHGTGLGLSVVYGIVRESGGAITVHSEPGWGSVFTVYLPAISTDVESPPEMFGSLPHGTERVLLVDDEELLVEMGKDMLEDLGYHVTATTNSIEALDLFREHPAGFDLVITDTTMPNMNGVELSREILKVRPDIPIILCTGFSELIDEEHAAAIGVKKFIMKPFSVKSIAELIRGVLED